MGLVERIIQKCDEIGINMSILEQNCGFGHSTIGKWRKNSPRIDTLEKVSKYLNVSLDWLVTGKESGELTEDERKLVELYRLADERGKRRILRGAEDEAEELELSSSKIG